MQIKYSNGFKVGAAARKFEAEKRVRRAIETIDQHFTNGPTEQQVSMQMLSQKASTSVIDHRRKHLS